MSRRAFFALTIAFLFCVPVAVRAEALPVRLVIDGVEVPDLPAPPIILNDRTLVPVREVFERVGGNVGWHAGHRQVSLFYGDDVLVMTIDEQSANLNGDEIEMHIPPIIHNDRTMVPLRFPAEVFGFDVDWDNNNRTAIVNSTANGEGEPEVLHAFDDDPEDDPEDDPDDESADFFVPDDWDSDEDSDVDDSDEILPDYIPLANKEALPWEGTSDELPPPGVTLATAEPGKIELAVDVSPAEIQTMTFPQTTVTDLQTPLETGVPAYVVRASSPISEVSHFLLPDNRLVVDIHNALAEISGDFDAPGVVPVSAVRASQFSTTPVVTRVVFEVVGAAEYSISLSADRTLLTVSFSKNRISAVIAHSDASSDTLLIQGDVVPNISISTEGFPHFITVNISNATMGARGGYIDDGVYAVYFSTGERADGSAFIRVYVREWPSFSLAASANSAAFMLHRGISGVRYDSVNRELRIRRDFNMNIRDLQQHNDYLNFQYTFVLPTAAEVLGRGEISVLDGFINSVSITPVNTGAIHLTFNTTRVLNFSIDEDDEYFIIRAHLPRDISPFIVVIDPGHGGTDPGAVQNNVVEKELTLAVSHMVMELLDADPFITAYMTRRDDTFVSLLNRAYFANSLGADLFVSIHANAAEVRRGVVNPEAHGIETWYTVGAREAAAGNRMNSRRLAEIIHPRKIAATGATDRGLRNAPNFVVLRETQMPAVLLELGFLTNPAEAARLSTDAYRRQLAYAIYQGITSAFAAYPRQG